MNMYNIIIIIIIQHIMILLDICNITCVYVSCVA